MRETYTREEILHALRLEPCHVTGMHTPEHHLDYTCDLQRTKGYERVLKLIEATDAEIPRALHENCGWCTRVPGQEQYRERLRRTYEWAGVEIPAELAAPAPDAPEFDVKERDIMRVVRRLGSGRQDRWVSQGALPEALDLHRHSTLYQRPLARLIDKGKLEETFNPPGKSGATCRHVRVAK